MKQSFSFFSGSREEESSCGRPLGIRVGPNGTLFVADAYLGLFEVNPTTGESGSGETLPPAVPEIHAPFSVRRRGHQVGVGRSGGRRQKIVVHQ